MTKTIAITGGIGSGKSTVSKMIRNLGYCVFDADDFSRDVLFDPEVETKIKFLFGESIFLEKGKLDRIKVRERIYQDPSLKKGLESILHPAISEELNEKKSSLRKLSETAWIFYEASLILEIGKKNHFDACIVVVAENENRIKRLTQSRPLKEEDIQKIMSSQMPDHEKLKHADYVIENSGSIEDLEKKVFELMLFLYKKLSPSSF